MCVSHTFFLVAVDCALCLFGVTVRHLGVLAARAFETDFLGVGAGVSFDGAFFVAGLRFGSTSSTETRL